MKAQINDKIRIINKMNDWSMEYKEGDIFTVEGTWYGGVNVTSKTGVPLSLDEVEYELISKEEKSADTNTGEVKVIFHVHGQAGFFLALNHGEECLQHKDKYGVAKLEIMAEEEAVLACRSGNDAAALIKKLQGLGLKIVVCQKAMKKYEISEEELSDNIAIVEYGVMELIKRQAEGYAYICC